MYFTLSNKLVLQCSRISNIQPILKIKVLKMLKMLIIKCYIIKLGFILYSCLLASWFLIIAL